ncbi:hypothetical protein GAO09_00735 [Rhizobiales bacterium RZME27]|uniref:Uncharacterized protein n=1 Tax=Endobacterium cereale TaxID=2663029 RepID=A0A6A8A4V9_9HYPH|nr:hypothetical protein [Endobacterium cereale]MEB2843484.1 hypothetical protein [Endobacterium cereale]MQY44600.1 hypothetical protein [Endobacterium cereale]
MNKTIRVAMILAVSAGSILAHTAPASAQWRDGPARWDDRRGPPPPPPRRHHRDRDTGKVIAGGLAAGVIGGLIGGALANGNNNGPRYIEEPPPPRCWFEDRRVQNAYDGGWHYENVRVCN